MPEEKMRQYVIVEEQHAISAEYELNQLAAEGYEVIAMTPGGTDDRGLVKTIWTLRLQARLRPPGPPVNQPLVSHLASAAITLEEKLEKLRAHVYESLEGIDRTLSVLVRRLEALEAWRLETELHLPRPESDDEGRWLPGAGVAFPHRKAQDRAGEEND